MNANEGIILVSVLAILTAGGLGIYSNHSSINLSGDMVEQVQACVESARAEATDGDVLSESMDLRLKQLASVEGSDFRSNIFNKPKYTNAEELCLEADLLVAEALDAAKAAA